MDINSNLFEVRFERKQIYQVKTKLQIKGKIFNLAIQNARLESPVVSGKKNIFILKRDSNVQMLEQGKQTPYKKKMFRELKKLCRIKMTKWIILILIIIVIIL